MRAANESYALKMNIIVILFLIWHQSDMILMTLADILLEAILASPEIVFSNIFGDTLSRHPKSHRIFSFCKCEAAQKCYKED